MCYGGEAAWVPAVVAAVAGTGSAYAANRAQNKQVEAQAEAEKRDRFAQAELQRQADAKVQQGISEFTPQKQDEQLAQATQQRTQALQAAPAPTDQYQAAAPETPTVVSDDLNRRLQSTAATAKDAAARRARLGAYGDASMQQGFDMNRVREGLRRSQLESQGSSRMLPYALREASNAGSGDRNNASILGIVSDVAGKYSIYGGGKAKPPTGNGSMTSPGGYGDLY